MSVILQLCSDWWGMAGLIVTVVGGAFTIAGSDSVWTLLLAWVMLAIGLAMLTVHYTHAKKAQKIVAEGNFVDATIINVRVNRFTNINTSPSHWGPDDPSVIHPTVIRFAYSCDGQYYEGSSGLLWQAAEYRVGDPIKVYVSHENPKRYAL